MIRKLRRKFLIAAVAAVFLVLLILIGAINVINFHVLIDDADETLQILSANNGSFPRQMYQEQRQPDAPDPSAGAGAPPADGRGRPSDPRHGGYGELAYQSRFFTVCFDPEGNCTGINLDNLASLTETEAEALARSVYSAGLEKGFADEYRYCRTLLGEETMLLFLNCQRELSTCRSFLYASIGISLVGMLSVFLLLLVFSGRIVQPIAESYEKQKRFITDAGHELKTPLTIIRADADVLESELDGESEWIEDIRRQTQRLSELTSDLIYLSRMEEENAALPMQVLPLSELAEDTARSFEALARTQGKDFRLSVAPGLQILGEEKSIAKLVSILLDNAMKYSPEGGYVQLSLEKAGRNARLIVKNSTLHMEKGNADFLFERFARGDSSRNSESGGFGLGLAIAKAITETHRGRIHAESEDGASLTVAAELPLS